MKLIIIAIMKAKTAIPKAPSQLTSNTPLKTPNTPIIAIMKPISTIIGFGITYAININIATIISNTMIASSDAAIALRKDDLLLKTLAANQTGIDTIIHAARKPIIKSIISIVVIFSKYI